MRLFSEINTKLYIPDDSLLERNGILRPPEFISKLLKLRTTCPLISNSIKLPIKFRSEDMEIYPISFIGLGSIVILIPRSIAILWIDDGCRVMK